MAIKKFLDQEGLSYFWDKAKEYVDAEVKKDGEGNVINTTYVKKVNNVAPVDGNVTIAIPAVTDTYSADSTNAMSGKAVASALSTVKVATATTADNATTATSADSATKATQDASGNVITETYVPKDDISSVVETTSIFDKTYKSKYCIPTDAAEARTLDFYKLFTYIAEDVLGKENYAEQFLQARTDGNENSYTPTDFDCFNELGYYLISNTKVKLDGKLNKVNFDITEYSSEECYLNLLYNHTALGPLLFFTTEELDKDTLATMSDSDIADIIVTFLSPIFVQKEDADGTVTIIAEEASTTQVVSEAGLKAVVDTLATKEELETAGKVKTVNDIEPDASGNITINDEIYIGTDMPDGYTMYVDTAAEAEDGTDVIAKHFIEGTLVEYYMNAAKTSATKIGAYVLQGASIEEIDFPSVEIVEEGACGECKNLTSVNLPSATTIGEKAFAGCINLETLNLPNAMEIGCKAFSCFKESDNLEKLKTVILPKAVTIGERAFYDASALETLEIPEAVTIDYSAFAFCNISKLVLGESIEYIYSSAFKNNPIELIYIYATTPPTITDDAFSGIDMSSVKIFVPYSAKANYKNAAYSWDDGDYTYYAMYADLKFSGATDGTVIFNEDGKQVSTTVEFGCDGSDYTCYNKNWGKVVISTEAFTSTDEEVVKTITAPTDYITVTYEGLSNDIKDAVSSIVVSYENIEFQYDSFPVVLALPAEGASIAFEAKFTGYKKITRADNITSTQTITLTDPDILPFEIVTINSANATDYPTLVDGTNFEADDDYIQSGSASYNVDNGHSRGYITFTTPSEISSECDCVTIKCYASSENGYDFGYAYISDSSTPTYSSGYSGVRDATASATTSGYIAKSAGDNSSVSTFTSGVLSPDTTYTLSIGYVKDSGSDDNDDRFYIEEITFPQAY